MSARAVARELEARKAAFGLSEEQKLSPEQIAALVKKK